MDARPENSGVGGSRVTGLGRGHVTRLMTVRGLCLPSRQRCSKGQRPWGDNGSEGGGWHFGAIVVGDHAWRLQLVRPWRLDGRDGPVRVSSRQQRLISLVALQGARPLGVLARILWPERTDRQASGNLRESLWTINHQLPGLLVADTQEVDLVDSVVVDTRENWRHVAAAAGRGTTERVRLLGQLREVDVLIAACQRKDCGHLPAPREMDATHPDRR